LTPTFKGRGEKGKRGRRGRERRERELGKGKELLCCALPCRLRYSGIANISVPFARW